MRQPYRRKDSGRKKKSTDVALASSTTFFDPDILLEETPRVWRIKREMNELIGLLEKNRVKKRKGKDILLVMDDEAAPVVKADSDLCKICMDQKPSLRMFKKTNCGHYFCFECTQKHIATKLKDENMINVCCPESRCSSLITPQLCKTILPWEVVCRWERALCYTQLPPVLTFNCPYKYCSVKLRDYGEEIRVREYYECPQCHKKICAKCRDCIHKGMNCNEKETVKRAIEEEEFLLALSKIGEKENGIKGPDCNNLAAKKKKI